MLKTKHFSLAITWQNCYFTKILLDRSITLQSLLWEVSQIIPNHPKSSQIKKRHSSSVSFCSSFLGPAFELLRDLECFKDCRALAKKNCLVDSCAFWLCPRRKPNHCSIGNSVIRPKPSIQGQKLAGLVWHIKAVTSATLWMFWHVCGAMKHEPRGCFISEHFPAAIKAKTSTATKPDNAISHRSFKERALCNAGP